MKINSFFFKGETEVQMNDVHGAIWAVKWNVFPFMYLKQRQTHGDRYGFRGFEQIVVGKECQKTIPKAIADNMDMCVLPLILDKVAIHGRHC